MEKLAWSFRWILFLVALLVLMPVTSSSTAVSNNPGIKTQLTVTNRSYKKPSVVKRMVYKIAAVVLKTKKASKAALIIAAVLAIMLVGFIAFAAAYGGASGAAVSLILILGLGLIVFGLIKLSKKRKRRLS